MNGRPRYAHFAIRHKTRFFVCVRGAWRDLFGLHRVAVGTIEALSYYLSHQLNRLYFHFKKRGLRVAHSCPSLTVCNPCGAFMNDASPRTAQLLSCLRSSPATMPDLGPIQEVDKKQILADRLLF